jgi:CHAT domain-containing protein
MPERLRMAIYEARANVVLHSGNMSESQQAEAIRQIELAVAHDDSDRAFSEKWPMLAQLGEVYWARNERGKALKKLEHAAALALSELEAAPDETIIQQRSSQYARVVNSLFRAYVAVGKPLEALAALDMSQAAGLRFGMLQNDSENEERKKKRAERQLENMIGTLFGGRPAHVDRKKVELDTAPTKQAICRLANISNHSNLAVLVLSIHHGTCSAILIFPDRSDIVPLQWNFDRRTHDLLFAVHIALKHGPFREKRLQRVCRELGSALLRGVLPELRSRHARCLAICAPGLISHWPFEAFRESPDSPVCVGAEFPVLYIPSLSISAALAERATATLPRRLLVIPYTGDDLKEAAVEVETLRSLPGGCVTVFDGGRYPKLKLLEELAGDYGFIHFACHGDFDIVNPLRSGLYLNASQSGDSNALRAEDLAKIRFRHAPVVTMSACEAALTSFDASNSFTGLPGSLLRAGARGIVGGRWTVYDATARDFMLRLYASFWQGQCSPSECVLQVQSEFRSERGIEEWASFSYLGVN